MDATVSSTPGPVKCRYDGKGSPHDQATDGAQKARITRMTLTCVHPAVAAVGPAVGLAAFGKALEAGPESAQAVVRPLPRDRREAAP